jgi:hypothetical protein
MPGSIGDILYKTLKTFSREQFLKYTDKTPSTFSKISDPMSSRDLYFNMAIELDKMWSDFDGTTPFKNHMSAALDLNQQEVVGNRVSHALDIASKAGLVCGNVSSHDEDGILDIVEIDLELNTMLEIQKSSLKAVNNLKTLRDKYSQE